MPSRRSEIAVHERQHLDHVGADDVDETDLKAAVAVLGIVDEADLRTVQILGHVEDERDLGAVHRFRNVAAERHRGAVALDGADVGETGERHALQFLLEAAEEGHLKAVEVAENQAAEAGVAPVDVTENDIGAERRAKAVHVGAVDVGQRADLRTAHRVAHVRDAADVEAVHLGRVGVEDVEIETEDVPAVEAPRQLDGRRESNGDRRPADRAFRRIGFLADCERWRDRREGERRETELDRILHFVFSPFYGLNFRYSL